jgi:hypothetical protein
MGTGVLYDVCVEGGPTAGCGAVVFCGPMWGVGDLVLGAFAVFGRLKGPGGLAAGGGAGVPDLRGSVKWPCLDPGA